MQKLIKGLHHFQEKIFPEQEEFFLRLAEEQKPEVLFITCSDSRIHPNLLTQTQPGELFIMRHAGNIIPAHGGPIGGAAATIEFAVTALQVKDIVVCGHSDCGAMKALLHPADLENLPCLASWLKHADATRRIIEENYRHLDNGARMTATVQENVLVQIENLRTHPAVAAALAAEKLQIHAWVYKIESGNVFAFDQEQAQFLPIGTELPPVPTPTRRLPAI